MDVNIDFLKCFRNSAVNREAVWNIWEKSIKFRQVPWYSSIERAIAAYYEDFDSNKRDPGPELCTLLKECPSVSNTPDKRWLLFSTALDAEREDWRENQITNYPPFITCKALSDAFPGEPFRPLRNQSMFDKAATTGATPLVQHLLGIVVDILAHLGPKDTERNKLDVEMGVALQHATDSLRIEAMEAILEKFHSLATDQRIRHMVRLNAARDQRSPYLTELDTALVANGDINRPPPRTDSEIEKRRTDKDTLKAFDTLLRTNPQLASESTYEQAIRPGSSLIFEHLVVSYIDDTEEKLPNSRNLRGYLRNVESAQYLLEHGNQLMWDIYCQKVLGDQKGWIVDDDDSDAGLLLRSAVRHGKVYAVRWILKQCPILAVLQVKDEYPLQALPIDKDDGTCREIRNLLLPTMLRMGKMYIIRKILDLSNVHVNEITLPLSQFNAQQFNFLDFISGLTGRGEGGTTETSRLQCLRFERVLKSVDFPDLNGQLGSSVVDDVRKDHREVEDVLHWLSNEKGVEEIINLKVPDRLHSPHKDYMVRHFVQKYKVETLDWRKLDLYLVDYDEDWKPLPHRWAASLQKLTLYSSGNTAVHDHWMSHLRLLKNLRQVDIYVVEESDLVSLNEA
ncbi:unnamed protein product [Periconia digitata]|uniref:Uncharacterized protein n=1 Tax=Periconia digitata TaxID=1303443 RepID=A0A9W4UPY4_9PLEO|nr:unnamed protein product [Periconia digitata]